MKFHTLLLFVFLVLFGLCTNVKAQQSTGFGDWRLYYFQDEFGDPMYDKPFLETKVKNSNGDVLAIAFTNKVDSGLDMLSLGISNGYSFMSLNMNASVSFKTSDGAVYKFTVPNSNLRGGQIFLDNQKELSTIGKILNSGNFKISISAHWAGDTPVSPNHNWSFSVTTQTKDMLKAYMKYMR